LGPLDGSSRTDALRVTAIEDGREGPLVADSASRSCECRSKAIAPTRDRALRHTSVSSSCRGSEDDKSGKPTTLSKMKTSRKIAEYQRTEI